MCFRFSKKNTTLFKGNLGFYETRPYRAAPAGVAHLLAIPGPAVGVVRAAPGSAPAGRPSSNHMRNRHLVGQHRLPQNSTHLFAHQGENTMKSRSCIGFISNVYGISFKKHVGFQKKGYVLCFLL